MSDAVQAAASGAREFLTRSETHYRPMGAPEVATLHINAAAPDASLIALAMSRVDAMHGVLGVFMQDLSSITQDQQHAIEGVICAAEEVRLLLEELQRRDGLQYSEANQ